MTYSIWGVRKPLPLPSFIELWLVLFYTECGGTEGQESSLPRLWLPVSLWWRPSCQTLRPTASRALCEVSQPLQYIISQASTIVYSAYTHRKGEERRKICFIHETIQCSYMCSLCDNCESKVCECMIVYTCTCRCRWQHLPEGSRRDFSMQLLQHLSNVRHNVPVWLVSLLNICYMYISLLHTIYMCMRANNLNIVLFWITVLSGPTMNYFMYGER